MDLSAANVMLAAGLTSAADSIKASALHLLSGTMAITEITL
jgi:hypothetical protein